MIVATPWAAERQLAKRKLTMKGLEIAVIAGLSAVAWNIYATPSRCGRKGNRCYSKPTCWFEANLVKRFPQRRTLAFSGTGPYFLVRPMIRATLLGATIDRIP